MPTIELELPVGIYEELYRIRELHRSHQMTEIEFQESIIKLLGPYMPSNHDPDADVIVPTIRRSIVAYMETN